MKIKLLHSSIVSTVVTFTLASSAASDTEYFDIANLEVSGTSSPAGATIWPVTLANTATNNPANCASVARLEILSTVATENRESMNKILLAALLSGKKVRAKVSSSTCSSNGYPAYYGIRLAADQ